MAWAATHKVVLGCIAFVVFWVLAVFPAVPFLPIGRTAGSVLGGVLMVVFQVISPNQAFDAVDLPILGLLFGTMVVSVYLERADLFKYLGSILSWRSRGGKDLLCRVCLLSAISSALFTNDTTCVVFTEFVLKLCKQHNLPALPFLMALATSSNIGSAATAIGNPQNLVIAVQSKISFGKFLIGVFPAMALGIVVNTVLLLLFYWKSLTHHKAEKDTKVDGVGAEGDVENPKTLELGDGKPRKSLEVAEDMNLKDVDLGNENPGGDKKVARDGVHSGRVQPVTHEPPLHEEGNNEETEHSPAVIDDLLRLETRRSSSFSRHRYSRSSSRQGDTIAPVSRSNSIRNTMTGVSRSCSQDLASIQDEPAAAAPPEVVSRKKKLRRKVWKISVYLVTVAMLAALLYGLNLSWSAMTAAVVLMVLDFSDAGPALDQVSYSLLVFFSGMFITVDGFNRTGAPGQLWNAVEPHARISSVSGVALLSLVVILLSNVASNVPTVLLLGARVAASAAATHGASVTRAWLMLAWVSTVAGNLTLVGSAANLIVSEQARRAESVRYNLSFWSHLRFGVPSTFIVIAVGLPLIQG